MGKEKVIGFLITFASTIMVLLMTGGAFAQVAFELLDTPDRGRWADFSLSRDGKNMGCLLGGAVYWWTATDGFQFLDTGSPTQGGVGMSARGNALIAVRATAAGTVPTIWYGDGSSIDLGFLAQECQEKRHTDQGYDLNADGSLAVGQASACGADIGFVWVKGQSLRGLDTDTRENSRGTAVSADGQTVVGFCEHPAEGFRRPAMWRGGADPLFFLGHDQAGEALNVSLDGNIVVGQAQMEGISPQAFFWVVGQQPVSLGNLSGRATDSSLASAVSDNGRVVGWSGDELWGSQEAFLWTARSGMRSLADILTAQGVKLPEGLQLTGALDISGDGTTVVGVCRDQYWNQLYWRARLDNSLASPPVAEHRPWDPQTTVPVSTDSLKLHGAEVLHPFPFGKRPH